MKNTKSKNIVKRVKVTVVVTIDAFNQSAFNEALRELRRDPPQIDVGGSYYSIKSSPRITIHKTLPKNKKVTPVTCKYCKLGLVFGAKNE